MNHKPDRKDFANARPAPAFGRIAAWFIDVVQLKNPDSYQQNSAELLSALQVLGKRTADTVYAGQMVTDDSKREIIDAIALCLAAHPSCPFGERGNLELATELRRLWAKHEEVSGRLTALPSSHDVVRVLIRQATVELAVRAGALAWLSGDAPVDEVVPIWSTDEGLRRSLREALERSFCTRDEAVAKLHQSSGGNSPGESEVDRWFDELDIPAPNHIRKWDGVLADAESAPNSTGSGTPLFRLYVGRRIWETVKGIVPADIQEEILRAYCRIKRSVFSHLANENPVGVGDENQRQRALAILVTGRITDSRMARQILGDQSDPLWRRHVEAVMKVSGASTTGLVELCQVWLAVAGVYGKVPPDRRPALLDDFVRIYFQKAESGGNPSAEYARLLEMAKRYESNGEWEKAEVCAKQLIQLAPRASGPRELLGTLCLFQDRPNDAVMLYHAALQLEPKNLTARGKLVSLLGTLRQFEEAEKYLFECPQEQRNESDWLFAHGKLLLDRGDSTLAKTEFLKCVNRGFMLRLCYQLLAVAAARLGETNEEREYQKRAREFE